MPREPREPTPTPDEQRRLKEILDKSERDRQERERQRNRR